MASLKEKMMQAKRMIQLEEYEDAAEILRTINHPTAKQWLDRISPHLEPSPKSSSLLRDIGIPLLVGVLMLVVGVAVGWLAKPTETAAAEVDSSAQSLDSDSFTRDEVGGLLAAMIWDSCDTDSFSDDIVFYTNAFFDSLGDVSGMTAAASGLRSVTPPDCDIARRVKDRHLEGFETIINAFQFGDGFDDSSYGGGMLTLGAANGLATGYLLATIEYAEYVLEFGQQTGLYNPDEE